MATDDVMDKIKTILVVMATVVATTTSQTCPQEDSIVHISQPGDVMIGALFKIHELTPDGSACSNMTDGASIQRVEAFLYAIERINKQNLVPGVTFGK